MSNFKIVIIDLICLFIFYIFLSCSCFSAKLKANAGPNIECKVGEKIVLDGSKSTGAVSYFWDFDIRDGLQKDALGKIVSHIYWVPGVYGVALTVKNKDQFDTDVTLVTVKPERETKLEELKIRPDHPRLFLNSENLPVYRKRWLRHPARYDVLVKANKGSIPEAAFIYQMTGDMRYARKAIRAMEKSRNVVELAIGFDWCYDQLSIIERQNLIKKLAKLADLNNNPPTGSAFTFHSESWAGQINMNNHYVYIVLAGHHPKAEKFYKNLWTSRWKDAVTFLDYLGDGSWPEGGYWFNRGKFWLIIDQFRALKYATGIDFFTHPYFKNIGYFILYQTDFKTKRLIYNNGDNNIKSTSAWQLRLIMLAANAEIRDPYLQWYINHLTKPVNGTYILQEALLYDPTLQEKSPCEGLPLSRVFPGHGVAMMRTYWECKNPQALWVSFKASDWYAMHVHRDADHFSVYKNGQVLIPDSGLYTYAGQAHYNYYFVQSVAHNTINVDITKKNYDNFINGQRLPGAPKTFDSYWHPFTQKFSSRDVDTSDLLITEFDSLYNYCAGVATNAYNRKIVQEFTRQMVLLKKGYLIIFDRFEVTDPTFKKIWLLHLNNKPNIMNGKVESVEVKDHIVTYSGVKLINVGTTESKFFSIQTLLPYKSYLKVIGGNCKNVSINLLRKFRSQTFFIKSPNYSDYFIIEYLNKKSNPPAFFPAIGIAGEKKGMAGIALLNNKNLILNLRPPGDNYIFDLKNYPTIGALYNALEDRLPKFWQPSLLAGYEFWHKIYGTINNWAPVRGTMGKKRFHQLLEEAGKWRIEISPSLSKKRDYFLHVLTFNNNIPAPFVNLEEDSLKYKISINDNIYIYIISFTKKGKISGHISIKKIDGKILVDKHFKESKESHFN